MKPTEILQELRRLVGLAEIEITPLLPDSGFQSAYAPLNAYLDQLQRGTKPETATEGVLRALVSDVLGIAAIPQVNVGSGFVDFTLEAAEESTIVIELKPLFRNQSGDCFKRDTLVPAKYTKQIEKYLQRAEYLVLTDLHDAYLYSARDVWQQLRPFAKLSFADLLERALETRSLLDVLRAAEDGEARPDLDRSFFEQLQDWFEAFRPIQFTNPDEHDELVIQFLNQLIFAKTMEDHSLVRYRFLQDKWQNAKDDWQTKGMHRVVEHFTHSFEAFFSDYYDTELFERSIWESLDKDPANLERFAAKVEAVLGVDQWSKTFQRGIVHFNYRLINEDIFGKSYEMFLAANRKDEGIYYTPATITTPMADSLVDSLCGALVTRTCEAVSAKRADFATADALMAQLARVTIGDTASGSGGFLIKVLRALWRHYLRLEEASGWVKNWQTGGDLLNTPPNVQQAREFRRRWNLDNRRVLVAQILLRHIYAVDKDAGAIEVAKTNLWKEAVKLSKDDYNFRRLTGNIQRTLPNLRLNFVCADSLVDTDPAEQVRYLTEVCGQAVEKLCTLREQYIANPSEHAPLEEALQLQTKLRKNLTEHFQAESLPAPALFVALSFFPAWFQADGSPKPSGSRREVAPSSSAASEAKEDQSLSRNRSAGFQPAFDGASAESRLEIGAPSGSCSQSQVNDCGFLLTSAATEAGFDGVIGNPPWEAVKPVKKEFSRIAKYSMDPSQFEEWFRGKLKEDAEFRASWESYESSYAAYKEYLGRRFKRQGTGDWNLFKLFIERDLDLVRTGGCLSLLVPSSIQTDEGCTDLRRLLMRENALTELTSFENKGYRSVEGGKEVRKQIFPDIHPQFKFGFFKVVKGIPTDGNRLFDGRFYLHDPADVKSPPVKYSLAMMERFSPRTYSIMEFRSSTDYALCSKIRGEHLVLESFGFQFRRELHPADDVDFYLKDPARKLVAGELTIFEGKMIHQFDTGFMPRNFHAVEDTVKPALLRKELFRLSQFVRESGTKVLEGEPVPKKKVEFEDRIAAIFAEKQFKIHYECERLVYRRVGSSTNERTIITTILPPLVFLSDTLSYLTPCDYKLTKSGKLSQEFLPADQVRSLLCLLNSLTLNYYIRSKISATVNMFYVYELPVPKLTAAQRKKLAEAASELLKQRAEPNSKVMDQAGKFATTRAALEVFIARDLYGLTLDDWKHLTSTFTFGGESETKPELDEIIRRSLALWSE